MIRHKDQNAIGHIPSFRLLSEDHTWERSFGSDGIGYGFFENADSIDKCRNKVYSKSFSSIAHAKQYLGVHLNPILEDMKKHGFQRNNNFGVQIATADQVHNFIKSTKPVSFMERDEIDSLFTERYL